MGSRSLLLATMPTTLTPADLDARADLTDWRYLLGRIETTYRCGTFGAAGRLAAAIAEAADVAGHHPDVDLRYPDVVHVALTTHAADGAVTDLDAGLAVTITRTRCDRRRRVRAHRRPGLRDRHRRHRHRRGAAVLGGRPRLPRRPAPARWADQPRRPGADRADDLVPADGRTTPAAQPGPRRRHRRPRRGGGSRGGSPRGGWPPRQRRRARAFWVLADAEGNEACVCTWLDRG